MSVRRGEEDTRPTGCDVLRAALASGRRDSQLLDGRTFDPQPWDDADAALEALLVSLREAEAKREKMRQSALVISAESDRMTSAYARVCDEKAAVEARLQEAERALREIARREYIGETTDGIRIDSPVHGREEANAIARAALVGGDEPAARTARETEAMLRHTKPIPPGRFADETGSGEEQT